MFKRLMTDRVTVRTRNGATYPDVAASVQPGKIFILRTDIPMQPGDEIIRRTPAGIEELFIVEDPGFHKGVGGIPDTYQMTVRRSDAKPRPGGIVIYNISGENARFNINSVDSSTNIINQAPRELFQALRDAIRSKVEDSSDREQLLARANELERKTGEKGFAQKYAEFMALAANHMEVFGPFIPALTQLLMGG